MLLLAGLACLRIMPVSAQPATQAGAVSGVVRDQTGGVLPGATVELLSGRDVAAEGQSDAGGRYRFDDVAPGTYTVVFKLLNFGEQQRPNVVVGAASRVTVDAALGLSLSADVVVTGKRSFVNLADAEDPAENLVGIAQSASQGAITARQLEVRPVLRAGEVLETVPGVIITQHSGEGKANQYFLRGFNLDHGSDFATTVAGVPVNMPTHAHSQGYSDINFLIPELVSGVQFSKGPYFADQGDFATAGSSTIAYATELERPMATLEAGQYGFGRGLFAGSRAWQSGHLLGALELSTNAGPWTVPDDYRKVNGVLRYTRGDAVNGLSLTAMGYHGRWNASEASPERAIASGLIGRFGSIDDTDGGRTGRYSVSAEWQRSGASTLTKVSAFAMRYDLNLISNFTFYLDDPVQGDQVEQVDRRWVTGVRVSQRHLGRWLGRSVQHTYGVQFRNDAIAEVALYHTERRVRLETRGDASALVSSLGAYGMSEIEWAPHVRLTGGIRADGSRYRVETLETVNSGTARAGLVSPKGGATFGPWKATEFYVNAGMGFHSNNALGTTITVGPDGAPVDKVTPLVRAKGAEVGVRSVAVPHLQATASLWTLRLGSELVYNGDVGATEPGPASERHGIEIANYYSPRKWLVFDADLSLSSAHFSDGPSKGAAVPEAVSTVVSAGVSVDGFRRTFGSLRWRYFGPRSLVEDDSVRSAATSLANLQLGYQPTRRLRVTADLFNLLNTQASDIDYFFTSRLPGEPLSGIEDRHFHPAVPRTLRVATTFTF
ncbi:MAG: TonB-dependent receptor [Vicinamibacterales bacterium]